MSTPKPTQEQIAEARDVLLPLPPDGETAELNREGVDALCILIAATEPPTDEELAEEAARVFPRRDDAAEREGYAAGARREGRR